MENAELEGEGHSPSRCEDCGAELVVGSWPFCRGTPESHETARSRRAQGFDPIVVFRAPDGSVRVPGTGAEPTPDGYERVELRTRREIDGFLRAEGTREALKAEGVRLKEDLYFGAELARNRAEVRRMAEGADGWVREFVDTVCREMDRRDRDRARYDAGVYFPILENWERHCR